MKLNHLLDFGLAALPFSFRPFSFRPASQFTPVSCLTRSPPYPTIEELVDCFDGYTVPQSHYTRATYETAQPTPIERVAWIEAITSLLNVDGNCATTSVPTEISTSYVISLFTEAAASGGRSFCILTEREHTSNIYKRGWGFAAVPAHRDDVSRFVHFSAPHPKYDDGTPVQAASLFKSTGSKSLVISGRDRRAFLENTPCVIPRPGDPYYVTDPAHDYNEPFNDALRAIRAWQEAHGRCLSDFCAYLQMHGKKPAQCSSDNIFLSSGLSANSGASSGWYTDLVNRPVKRLKNELQAVFPSPTVISFPADRPACTLTATKNVFGRLVNGVADSHVCCEDAHKAGVTGEFVHAEQDTAARSSTNYDDWSTAVRKAFTATCNTDMSEDSSTRLCVPDTTP